MSTKLPSSSAAAPHSSWLSAPWRGMHQLYLWSFQPDPNSIFYLNRNGLNIVTLAMFFFDLLFGAFWAYLHPEAGIPPWLNFLFAFYAALAFINLHLRFIPWFSQLAIVVGCLWLNLPFFAFYIYLSAPHHADTLANAAVLLILYPHLKDWRSATVDIIETAIAAPMLIYFIHGSVPHPPLLQVLMLVMIISGSLTVAIFTASREKMRSRYARKVLTVTERQLEPMLQLQNDLIGNLRYEAKNIMQDDEQRMRVVALAEHMQEQVSHLQENLAVLSQTGSDSADLGSTKTWQMSDLLNLALHDLPQLYALEPQALQARIQLDVQSDFLIDANAELAHALAALFHAMLNTTEADDTGAAEATAAEATDTAPTHTLRIHCQRKWGHKGLLRLETSGLGSSTTLSAEKMQAALPLFAVYVFKRYEVRAKVLQVREDLTPTQIELWCFQPTHAGAANA